MGSARWRPWPPSAGRGFVVACIDARRGRVYLQAFIDGRAVMAARRAADAEAAAAARASLDRRTGAAGRIRAPLIAAVLPGAQSSRGLCPTRRRRRLAAARAPGAGAAALSAGAGRARSRVVSLEPVAEDQAAPWPRSMRAAFEAGWSAADIAALLAATGRIRPCRARGRRDLRLPARPGHRRRGRGADPGGGPRSAPQGRRPRPDRGRRHRRSRGGCEPRPCSWRWPPTTWPPSQLYAGAGFVRVGARPGYYGRAGAAVDALVLRSRP